MKEERKKRKLNPALGGAIATIGVTVAIAPLSVLGGVTIGTGIDFGFTPEARENKVQSRYERFANSSAAEFDMALETLGARLPEGFDVDKERELHLQDASNGNMAQAENIPTGIGVIVGSVASTLGIFGGAALGILSGKKMEIALHRRNERNDKTEE